MTMQYPEPMLEKIRETAAAPAYENIRGHYEDAPPKIARSLAMLEAQLFDPELNVSTLKRACAIRDNSWVIRFQLHVGTSPKRFITRQRIATAARLLVETDLKTWKIGDLLGYSSLSVFGRVFYREMGLRPKEYRERHQPARSTVATPFTTPELLDALEGKLTEAEARRLVQAILERYPDLEETSAVE